LVGCCRGGPEGRVNRIERLRRAGPVLKFVLLTFLIAYTIGYGLLWLRPWSSDLAGQYLPRIGVVYAPAIAALLVTGRDGIGGLLRKLNPRGQWLWVPVLLATGVTCTALAAFLFGVFGLSFLFTALWERVNGNIFVLAVAHASVNAPISLLGKQSVVDAVFVLYGLLGLIVLIRMMMRSNRVLGDPPDHQALASNPCSGSFPPPAYWTVSAGGNNFERSNFPAAASDTSRLDLAFGTFQVLPSSPPSFAGPDTQPMTNSPL
jgi:hypothetical protein